MKLFKNSFAISFIILIGLLGVLGYLKYQPEFLKQNQPNWLEDKINQPTKIEINKEQKIVLNKKDDQWLVESNENKPADQNKIDSLLIALEQLKPIETVSENPDHFSNYGLESDQAISLKLFDNDQQIFELLIGQAGPAYDKTYIRLPKQNKVYLSNVSLRSKVIQSTWLKSSSNQE